MNTAEGVSLYLQPPRKHSWTTIIPNSQVIVIPYPASDPYKYVIIFTLYNKERSFNLQSAEFCFYVHNQIRLQADLPIRSGFYILCMQYGIFIQPYFPSCLINLIIYQVIICVRLSDAFGDK